jgi:cyanophycin synthetase
MAWRLDLGRTVGFRSALRRVRQWRDEPDPAHLWNSYYRGIWEEAARELGADVVDIGGGFLSLRRDGRRTIVWQSNVKLDDPVTVRLSLDKVVCSGILKEAGLPVPEHVVFNDSDLAPARARLEDTGDSWVVKPAGGTGGGQGVTCGVRESDDLARACLRARRWDRRLLMERQLDGDEYRLLLLDGELLDVIRRRPPAVVGDGRSSVEALIDQENRHRRDARGRAGLMPIGVDLDCLLAVRASGLGLTSVPQAGERVRVKTAANSGGPADTETVRHVAPDLVEQAALAARVVGIRLAGVDVIGTDLTRPLAQSGGAIVELNAMPGLHYHYLVADSDRSTRVAVPILAKLLDEGQ